MRSVHSRRALTIQRSQIAFARGAWTGVMLADHGESLDAHGFRRSRVYRALRTCPCRILHPWLLTSSGVDPERHVR